MAICIVYDKATNTPINVIMAEITDEISEEYYLELLPDNAYWNGSEIIIQDINTTSNNPIDSSKDI